MTVGELCSRPVETIGSDATLIDAARRMRESHVGALVVVEEREGRSIPLGILTDRDIVVGVAAKDLEHFRSLLVADVVHRELVTARREHGVHEALKQMRTHGVRRLPIVDEHGALFGILTLDDILVSLADALGEAAALVAHAQQQERTRRVA